MRRTANSAGSNPGNLPAGNVIFDGNIIVWGAVESGYTVRAGRDLTILDTVEGADLTAGKDLDAKYVDPAEKLKTLEEEAKDLRGKLDSSIKGIIEAEAVYRGAVLSVGNTRKTIDDLTADFSLYQHFNKT
jgi:hypothetical protein